MNKEATPTQGADARSLEDAAADAYETALQNDEPILGSPRSAYIAGYKARALTERPEPSDDRIHEVAEIIARECFRSEDNDSRAERAAAAVHRLYRAERPEVEREPDGLPEPDWETWEPIVAELHRAGLNAPDQRDAIMSAIAEIESFHHPIMSERQPATVEPRAQPIGPPAAVPSDRQDARAEALDDRPEISFGSSDLPHVLRFLADGDVEVAVGYASVTIPSHVVRYLVHRLAAAPGPSGATDPLPESPEHASNGLPTRDVPQEPTK